MPSPKDQPSPPDFVYGETPVVGIQPLDIETIRRIETGSAPDATVPSVDDVTAEREKYAARVKKRLGSKQVTEIEARDGLRDCFVATYLGGVSQGLDNFAIRGDVSQVKGVVESIFRRRLKAHGSSWDAPTVEGLQSVKDEIDVETHLDELPAELKSVHDQVCTLLIGKARGDVVHVGDRSAVKAESRGEATLPPTAAPAQAAAAPTPAPAQAAPTPAPAQATPVQPAPAAREADPVLQQMRNTVATLLEQMAVEARAGADVDALFERAGQLTGLIDTLQTLSKR